MELGDHGEGCCKVCHFIEPLTPRGFIANHKRGGFGRQGDAQPCEGSYRRPQATTPDRVPALEFSDLPFELVCPVCHETVTVRLDHHSISYHIHRGAVCYGSNTDYGRRHPLRSAG
jgi:hypothetical protein